MSPSVCLVPKILCLGKLNFVFSVILHDTALVFHGHMHTINCTIPFERIPCMDQD